MYNMKTVVLIVIALLWCRSGYSYDICEVKKTETISVQEANDWGLSATSTTPCLTVWILKAMKIKQHHIQQINNACVSEEGLYAKRIVLFPIVVDKKWVGIYGIIAGYEDDSGMLGCALYDRKQLILPHAPQVTPPNMPEDIYQARLEVVKAFLERYKNFTEKQKKEIERIFTKGNFTPPSEPRYF
jgi:hypothetical protein